MNLMIRNIITDDVLYGFNYQGKFNKHPLSEYTIFSKYLRDICDPTGKHLKQYIKDLGYCIRLSHIRIYKQSSRKKAKKCKTELTN